MDLTKYPRPSVAVDLVIFGYQNRRLSLLLIERGLAPFIGMWALPGGFVREHESVEDAAKRELKEEAGLENVYLEQLYTFGEPKRDPRGRVISVAYFALVKPEDHRPIADTDAISAKWCPIDQLPVLAFDHAEIISMAHRRLRGKIRYEPVGFELLPKLFTLTQLQEIYETILGEPLDKRNFRKKILSYEILKETDRKKELVPYRAPALYRFDIIKYRKLVRDGFRFEL
jgi:8-oxo-dGTP diphosphatase